MTETQKGFAVLEEVDESTFERFVEWAYKGYYKAADFEMEVSSHPSPVSSNKEECEETKWTEKRPTDDVPVTKPIINFAESPTDWSWEESKQDKKINRAKTSQELKESFLHREYTARQEMINILPTRANRGAHEDYTEVFLSHTRLYVFAEKYDIQSLKTLALEELHNTLAIYTLYRRRTGDIVALLRYVYANTGVPARGSEDLRTLLRDYVGYETKVLIEDEDFKDLMVEDRGPLLRDFLKMVAKLIT